MDAYLYLGYPIIVNRNEPKENEWDDDYETHFTTGIKLLDLTDFFDRYGGYQDTPWEEFPFELGYLGDHDWLIFPTIMYLKEHSTCDAIIEEISPDDFQISEEDRKSFKDWFDKNGLEWQEPKWYLGVSY